MLTSLTNSWVFFKIRWGGVAIIPNTDVFSSRTRTDDEDIPVVCSTNTGTCCERGRDWHEVSTSIGLVVVFVVSLVVFIGGAGGETSFLPRFFFFLFVLWTPRYLGNLEWLLPMAYFLPLPCAPSLPLQDINQQGNPEEHWNPKFLFELQYRCIAGWICQPKQTRKKAWKGARQLSWRAAPYKDTWNQSKHI